MKPSKEILNLKQLFDNESYEQCLEKALPMAKDDETPFSARLICACYIKLYQTANLDSFLKNNLSKKEQLEFEFAYSDYSEKRDSAWFLSSKSTHPRANQLKAQIYYRQMEYFEAAQKMGDCQSFEAAINKIAASARSNSVLSDSFLKSIQKQFPQKYELFYNLALYHFNHCQFEKANESILQCSQQFESVEQKNEKDFNNIKLLNIIIQIYCGKEVKFIASDEPEQIQPYLRVLDKVQQINFLQLDYQNMISAQAAIQEISKYLEGFELPEQTMQQIRNLQICLNCLQAKKQLKPLKFQSTKNYSQYQLSNLCFGYLCQQCLPTITIVRRFKRTPEQFILFQKLKMERRAVKHIQPEIYQQFGEQVNVNTQQLLSSFAAFSDLPKFGHQQKELVCLQDCYYSDIELNKIKIESTSTGKQEIMISTVQKQKAAKKPMPQKWIKKQKKTIVKQSHHQGQVVNDRTEISAVPTATNKGNGKYGKGRGRK